MVSLKLKIKSEVDPVVSDYIRQFNNTKRYAYNRFCEDLEFKEVYHLSKELNNIYLLDCSIIESAVLTARDLFQTSGKGVIFGRKKLFDELKYKKKKDKTEYKEHRNNYLRMVGKSNQYGNRKFEFDLLNNKITFKPKLGIKYKFEFENVGKNQKELLEAVQLLSDQKQTPITVSLSKDYIILGVDECVLQSKHKKDLKKNRILSIDSNPQFIGFSIIDWKSDSSKEIIHKEIVDLRELENVSTNKRNYEILQVSKRIADLARRFRCETVAVEGFKIKTKDHKKGKKFNKKVNNIWNRTKFFNNLKKWCNIYDIKVLEIRPQYSSFIGSLTNENEPDMVAASIEIGRRAYLFDKVYITKEISPFDLNGKKVEIIFPKFNRSALPTHWKEMVTNNEKLSGWKELFNHQKKLGLSYRLPFFRWRDANGKSSSRARSIKSNVFIYFS